MECRRRHWAAAFAVAASIHVAVAMAVLWQAPPTGAASAGVGGVEISLGAAGGAPGGAQSTPPIEKTADTEDVAPPPTPTEAPDVPPPPEPVETAMAPEPEPIPEPEPEPVEPEVVPEPVPAPEPEPVEKVEVPAPVPQPEPEPEPEPTVATVPPPPPPPQPQPKRPEPKPEPPEEVAEAPAPKPQPKAPPAEKAPPRQTAAVAPSAAGGGGKAGTEASPDAGDGADEAAGGAPGQIRDYMALLQAWLEKHKEYPRRARLRRQEGTALLYFVMDRDGRVLDFRLQQSSGHALLDEEVAEMVERAQPLPEMPDDMRQARLEVVVPVQFMLR